ncbi:unnamed protein product, partial [Symbiodinium necroappetens]
MYNATAEDAVRQFAMRQESPPRANAFPIPVFDNAKEAVLAIAKSRTDDWRRERFFVKATKFNAQDSLRRTASLELVLAQAGAFPSFPPAQVWKSGLLRPWALPISEVVDRSLCAEFQALSHICDLLDDAGVKQAEFERVPSPQLARRLKAVHVLKRCGSPRFRKLLNISAVYAPALAAFAAAAIAGVLCLDLSVTENGRVGSAMIGDYRAGGAESVCENPTVKRAEGMSDKFVQWPELLLPAMGQTACCCEKTDEERLVPVSSLTPGGIASTADPCLTSPPREFPAEVLGTQMDGAVNGAAVGEVTFWEQLEGMYVREQDGKYMASIQSNLVHWADEFRSDPSELSITGTREVCLSLGGRVYTAEISASLGTLLWDDGEELPLFSLRQPFPEIGQPSGELALNMFEDRYVELVRRLESGKSPHFGYTAVSHRRVRGRGVLLDGRGFRWVGSRKSGPVVLQVFGYSPSVAKWSRQTFVGVRYIATVQTFADRDLSRMHTGGREHPALETIWGQVYVQTGGGLGFASYHFHHPGECYISYERANNNTFPKLDDGSQPPAKKYFEEVVYDPGTRCFRGVIDWSPSSWQGDEKWVYNMVFSADLDSIVAGTVHAIPANKAKQTKELRFGVSGAAASDVEAALGAAEALAITAGLVFDDECLGLCCVGWSAKAGTDVGDFGQRLVSPGGHRNSAEEDALYSVLLATAKQTEGDLHSSAEDALCACWEDSGDAKVNAEMARGIELLDDQKAAGQLTGAVHPFCDKADEAVESFTRVTEMAPNFAEGWHKLSIAHYAKQALKLQPRHYWCAGTVAVFCVIELLVQVLDGHGQLHGYYELDEKQKARECWEAALEIFPAMPGAQAKIEEAASLLTLARDLKDIMDEHPGSERCGCGVWHLRPACRVDSLSVLQLLEPEAIQELASVSTSALPVIDRFVNGFQTENAELATVPLPQQMRNKQPTSDWLKIATDLGERDPLKYKLRWPASEYSSSDRFLETATGSLGLIQTCPQDVHRLKIDRDNFPDASRIDPQLS